MGFSLSSAPIFPGGARPFLSHEAKGLFGRRRLELGAGGRCKNPPVPAAVFVPGALFSPVGEKTVKNFGFYATISCSGAAVGRKKDRGGHHHVGKRRIHRDLSGKRPPRGRRSPARDLSNKSDFFSAPASARYHGAYPGGLCEHSLNVYHCLVDYLARERVTDLYGLEYSPESIALVALLHDVCMIGCYKPSTRNVKGEDGRWTQVPTFTYEDPLPYGHGEKSVYVVNGFVRLTREEAMAIRWHMGFSGTEDSRLVGKAFAKYPLAFALSVADMEATYFLEEEG